jgi:hypothetical protein
MNNEEIYEDYKSSPHAGNGNSDSDRLVNMERERMRREQGHYGAQYEYERRKYLAEKKREAGHAGN